MRSEKVKVNLSLNRELWEKVEKIAEEMGYKKSGLVELLLRQMVKSETSTLPDLIEGILKDLFEHKTASKKGKK